MNHLRALLLAFTFALPTSVAAQTQLNPSQIAWPLASGVGAPTTGCPSQAQAALVEGSSVAILSVVTAAYPLEAVFGTGVANGTVVVKAFGVSVTLSQAATITGTTTLSLYPYGQPYVDTSNGTRYSCASGGWVPSGTNVDLGDGSPLRGLSVTGFMPQLCSDTSGSSTAQSCTTPDPFVPRAGNTIIYMTTTPSGTALTLNVNGSGQKSVAVPGDVGWTTTLTAEQVPAGKPLVLSFDGVDWDVQQTGNGIGLADFASLGGGTNTTAQMLVGPGASFGAVGSGTIAATSVTGPVTDRCGERCDVVAFGAKGDGSTDDMAAIDSAISATQSSFKMVYFPCGNYVVSGFLQIPEYGLWSGENKNCATLTFTGYGAWIASHAYALNTLVKDSNGNSERVVVPGTSGSAAPSWNAVVGGSTTDGAVTWTNDGSPSCGNAVHTTNQNAGFIRYLQGNNRITELTLKASNQTAGTCMLNTNDGGETSGIEVDHNNIYGGSTSSTNVGLYAYNFDSGHIHNNIFEYNAQHILAGSATFASTIIGPSNIFTWGTNTSLYMVQPSNGTYCFNVLVTGNVFEGYGSTNGVSGCQTLTVSHNYLGDATQNGGTWLSGVPYVIGNWIDAGGTANHTLLSPSVVQDNIVYGTFGNGGLAPGTLVHNTFSGYGTTGCILGLNQTAFVTSTDNTWLSAGHSVCANNSLTPHPTLISTNDTDTTTNKFDTGGNLLVSYAHPVPTTYALLPTCFSGLESQVWGVTDSAVNALDATVSGGGTYHVQAYCGTDGATYAWRVSVGSAGGVTANAATFSASGGAAPGTTFTGASPVTVDATTVGAAKEALSNLASPTAINDTTLTFAGAAGLTAGGTNQNVTLSPSGSGTVSPTGDIDLYNHQIRSTYTAAPEMFYSVGFLDIGNASGLGVSVGSTGHRIPLKSFLYQTQANCASSVSPAICGNAAAGSFVIAANATSATVNTTAVTASSEILVTEDQSLGTALGVTCNTGISSLPAISARTAGTSFTVTISAGLATNPVCYSYFIVN